MSQVTMGTILKLLFRNQLRIGLSVGMLAVGTFAGDRIANAEQLLKETKTTIVKDTTTQLEIELNDKTVICSRADYSQSVLKILIPQLADLTVLNHRNAGAGSPCVAAGECLADNDPQQIIDVSRPKEIVQARVVITKAYDIDRSANTCKVRLVENVEIPIRSKTFIHQRQLAVGDRLVEDCQ